jgi:hypothetical protein
VMVVIIGTGYMTDEVKFAVSDRQPTHLTNVYHSPPLP